MSEKPLHVQVAEALGWRDCFYVEAHSQKMSFGEPPHIYFEQPAQWRGYLSLADPVLSKPNCAFMEKVPYDIPRYDTDWSATGPLIEKYGIELESEDCTAMPSFKGWRWWATKSEWTPKGMSQVANTAKSTASPLQAVCHLILELAKAGKL